MSKNRIVVFTLIGFVILIWVGFNYFEKQQNTKLIGTIDCNLSKIDVRLDLRPNALEGDGASYKIQYSTSAIKNITLGGGPLINSSEWNYILPINTDINISTYTSSNTNNDLVLFMPNEKLASHNDIKYKFSQAEFEYLDSCLQKNIDGLNTIFATLPSSLPSGIRDRATIVASAPKLTALVHVDGLQLQQLLQSAGINYQFLVFSSGSDERIIRVSDSGALRFDYYSDVGLDIFSTDFSKPLPEEYSWLNEYKNSSVSLIDYLNKVQQKVPIVFSE